MAKCLLNPKTKEAVRVSDEKADELAKKGWEYIGKTQWQRMVQLHEPAT